MTDLRLPRQVFTGFFFSKSLPVEQQANRVVEEKEWSRWAEVLKSDTDTELDKSEWQNWIAGKVFPGVAVSAREMHSKHSRCMSR